MATASLLAGAALAVLAGYRLAAAVGPSRWGSRVAASFAFGVLALPPLLLLAGLARLPLGALSMAALALLLAAATHAALPRGAPAPPAAAPREPWLEATRAIAAGALALALAKLARTPLWGWDHYAIWGTKARRLLEQGRLELAFLADPAFEAARGDHPLGVPMLWRLLALGEIPSIFLIRLTHAALLLALGVVVALGVERVARSRRAGALAAALVWLSPLGWDSGLVGLADLPLALGLALAGAALLAPASPTRAAGLAVAIGALPWIKQEGWPLALLLAGAALAIPQPTEARRTIRNALAGLALPLAAGAALFQTTALPRGKPYLDGDWRARAVERAGELPELALHAARLLADPTLLGLWFLLPAALAAALLRRDRAAAAPLAVVHLELLLALAVVYLSYPNPYDQLNAALPRVSAALVPLGLLGVAELFAGGGVGGGRAGEEAAASLRAP